MQRLDSAKSSWLGPINSGHTCTAEPGNSKKTRRRKRTAWQKCSLKNTADALAIKIYEWPLPADDLAKKSIVFELQVPEWFGY